MPRMQKVKAQRQPKRKAKKVRSEEHTSELQSQSNLVCRLLLEKKKKDIRNFFYSPAFADGLKIAFGILLLAFVCSLLGYFEIGLTMSLWALGSGRADELRPIIH